MTYSVLTNSNYRRGRPITDSEPDQPHRLLYIFLCRLEKIGYLSYSLSDRKRFDSLRVDEHPEIISVYTRCWRINGSNGQP